MKKHFGFTCQGFLFAVVLVGLTTFSLWVFYQVF